MKYAAYKSFLERHGCPVVGELLSTRLLWRLGHEVRPAYYQPFPRLWLSGAAEFGTLLGLLQTFLCLAVGRPEWIPIFAGGGLIAGLLGGLASGSVLVFIRRYMPPPSWETWLESPERNGVAPDGVRAEPVA